MKNKIIYALVIIAMICSCDEDFLNRPSETQPTVDNYYSTAEEVEAATGYLYNQVWYNWVDKAFHCIGEVLSGNMRSETGVNYGSGTYMYFTVQATDGQNLNAWRAFYKVAGNATVLASTLEQKRASVSDPSFIDKGIAECRFIRGIAYFNIARVYGDAPIVDDPVALAGSGDYNVPRYYQKDVLQFALEDFKAAEAGLPDEPYQPGRVTTWSAKGMAAKLYLYRADVLGDALDYDSAALKANEVIQSGKYELLSAENGFPEDAYKLMFTSPDYNNNKESLFALQWVASGGYSYANAIQAYAGPSNLLNPDFGTGYSSVMPSIDLLNAYETGDKRKGWSVMQQGFTEPAWTNANFPDGYSYDTMLTGSTDDAYHITTPTRSNSLKYVVGPASTGFEFSTQGGSDLCIYLLRYADVKLIYAEAILGANTSTSDATALAEFNDVRERAGLTPLTSLTKDIILKERRVELAFEGDYWFDIQRQGFTKAQQIISGQERGTYNGAGISHEHVTTFTSASQLYLPVPSDEIVSDPELAKPPVAYY